MIEVKVKSNASGTESAMRELRKKVSRNKVLLELRDRRFIKKKSTVNYEKKKAAKYAAKMQAEEDRRWR